jgi:hypothetical protein
MTDGLIYGCICPHCKMIARGEQYKLFKKLRWDKCICECEKSHIDEQPKQLELKLWDSTPVAP